MPRYANYSGQSGILSYEVADDSVQVTFGEGDCRTYIYTYGSAGSSHVEQMRRLAVAGRGLNGYINENVRKDYARKW